MAGKKTVAELRFWSRVRFAETPDGCWLWGGSLSDNGYGRFWDGERDTYAHIYSWLLHFGSLPEHLPQVTHKCNTPACVRPSHLVPATQKQNLEYMVACGRQARPWLGKKFTPEHIESLRRGRSGEKNHQWRHDLPSREMVLLYLKTRSVWVVARHFGCSWRAVAHRLRQAGVRWRSLVRTSAVRKMNSGRT